MEVQGLTVIQVLGSGPNTLSRSFPLGAGKILEDATPEIKLDPANDLRRCDQAHAMRKPIVNIHAQVAGPVAAVAVPQPHGPVPPAAAIGATTQSPIRMNELVVRIGFPVGRFTPAGQDDTGTILCVEAFGVH